MLIDEKRDEQQPIREIFSSFKPPALESTPSPSPGPSTPQDFQKHAEPIILSPPPQVYEDPPPDFSMYHAKYTGMSITGDILTHDPHLNTDGEALYRFLLQHGSTPPKYMLRCRGTHTRSKRDSNGRSATETVVDFDFYISLSQYLLPGVVWSVPDTQPAFRGTMTKEVATPQGPRAPSKEEENATKTRIEARKAAGPPPWPVPDGVDPLVIPDEAGTLCSSKSLRTWADEYCVSPKLLKEFVYTKVVYGWDFSDLSSAIRSTIVNDCRYNHTIAITFESKFSKVYVRPDNSLSRLLSNTGMKILLAVTLIYPLIALFKRLGTKGGGRWKVVGGAFALKRKEVVPVPDPVNPHVGTAQSRTLGTEEGDWYRNWLPTIVECVNQKRKSQEPIFEPMGVWPQSPPQPSPNT